MRETPEAGQLGDQTLQVELLPAGHGDSVLLEYGSPAAPARILVDAGPATAYAAVRARLARIPPERRRLDLLVVTHVDADHVEGVVKLLNDADLAVEVGELWFNGYRHLPNDELGPVQGEMVGALATHRSIAWNTAFGERAVKREPGRPLPRVELPGGLSITVLAPSDRELERLRREWERACDRAGLSPGSVADALVLLGQTRRLNPLDTYLDTRVDAATDLEGLAAAASDLDRSAPNASSIVLLVEYAGRRVLLAGDSTPDALVPALERLVAERNLTRLRLDAFKLPHHASRNNVTRELLRLVDADRSLVSTDGKHFGHPDDEAIARVIVDGPRGGTLVFNYRTDATLRWAEVGLVDRYGHRTDYPEPRSAGVAVSL
jgi:beta-lactamase superfamily II metal-dependent hydrolase